MAKKKTNTARDYQIKKVKLSNDFEIEMRCRIIGLQYLEDVYDKTVDKINFGSGKITDLVHLFTALALSTYPDMSIDEIKKKIGQLDITQLQDAMANSPDIFGVQAKNSKPPSQKVKGNLTEKS